MRERKFVKSGIAGLDKVSGGGLLEGSIVTIGGPTGAGKSTFGMQFLYEGAKQFGEAGMYVAIEESKDSMLFNMSGYNWQLEDIEKKQKLVFLDYPVYEVDQFLQQSGAVKEIINTFNVKRVVIDSIMPIALFFKNDEERKKGFMKFIDNVRSWGATTMIISEDTTVSTADALPSTASGIESFTDGWVNIGFKYDSKKSERVRVLEVLKMKGAHHSMRTYPVKMDESGFTIITK